jgi:tRNA (guanine37-N1)-methyltransferase
LRKRLKEILSGVIPPTDLVKIYNSYDIIGDIAVLRSVGDFRFGQSIAEAIMDVHKNVKTVVVQKSPVHGHFRLRKLQFVSGERKTATVHKECGCVFYVDLAECYFSPRLVHERLRIARQIKSDEVVVNMFAGVGCFSIVIAKHSNVGRIYSVDVNPMAYEFMEKNIRLNGVYEKAVPIFGDVAEIIKKRLRRIADRVLMPLPERSLEYLPHALLTIKKSGGWVHYYDFVHAHKNEDPVQKAESKVRRRATSVGADCEVCFGRVVRTTGPNWHQVVLDMRVENAEFSERQMPNQP